MTVDLNVSRNSKELHLLRSRYSPFLDEEDLAKVMSLAEGEMFAMTGNYAALDKLVQKVIQESPRAQAKIAKDAADEATRATRYALDRTTKERMAATESFIESMVRGAGQSAEGFDAHTIARKAAELSLAMYEATQEVEEEFTQRTVLDAVERRGG